MIERREVSFFVKIKTTLFINVTATTQTMNKTYLLDCFKKKKRSSDDGTESL